MVDGNAEKGGQWLQSFHVMPPKPAAARMRTNRQTDASRTSKHATTHTTQPTFAAKHADASARLNMTHGDHAWHEAVIKRIRQINAERGCELHRGVAFSAAQRQSVGRLCMRLRGLRGRGGGGASGASTPSAGAARFLRC